MSLVQSDMKEKKKGLWTSHGNLDLVSYEYLCIYARSRDDDDDAPDD